MVEPSEVGVSNVGFEVEALSRIAAKALRRAKIRVKNSLVDSSGMMAMAGVSKVGLEVEALARIASKALRRAKIRAKNSAMVSSGMMAVADFCVA